MERIHIKQSDAISETTYIGTGQKVAVIDIETGEDKTIDSLHGDLSVYHQRYMESETLTDKYFYLNKLRKTIDDLESVAEYYFKDGIEIIGGYCTCSCSDICPNGKTGSQDRCSAQELTNK